MDIITWAGIISVFVVGYLVFKPKSQIASPVVDPAVAIAARTEAIGADIGRAVAGMKELTQAVNDSLSIFDEPIFQKLEDFSLTLTPETVGRDNPFEQAAWKRKIKIDELDAAAMGRQTSGKASSDALLSGVASSTPDMRLIGR